MASNVLSWWNDTAMHSMSKMPTPTYYQTNSVIIKYAIFLNIMLYIFNIRDTEAVIGIIFVLLKIFDGLNQPTFYPNPIDNAICTQLTEYVSTSRAWITSYPTNKCSWRIRFLIHYIDDTNIIFTSTSQNLNNHLPNKASFENKLSNKK